MPRNPVAGVLAALVALSAASPVGAQTVVADRVTCRDQARGGVFQLISQLRISGCGLRSECRITWMNGTGVPGAAAADSLRAELIHEVDLAQDVDVAVQIAECGDSTQSVTLAPARLTSRRMTSVVGGIRSDRDDVPIFREDSARVTLLVSPAKVGEIRAAIEAARDLCRKRNR